MLGRCKYKRDISTMQENKQEKSPIKRKILLFLSENGISQYDFYRKTGITRGILGQNNGISEDNMARFLAAYPQVSVEWLLTGRGSMLRDQDIQLATPVVKEQFHLRTDHKVGLQSTPLYELDAPAGLVELFSDQARQTPISHIQIPDLPPCDGALYVRGDSMYPLLKSGDIVLYKEIANNSSGILWGEMYLLSFTLDGEDYITIKYIQKADDDRFVRLVSHNPHHYPKDIPADSIQALALVKASVRFNTMG